MGVQRSLLCKEKTPLLHGFSLLGLKKGSHGEDDP